MKKKRVTGYFPIDFLEELESNHEISFDEMGRARGFTSFVERMYKRRKDR
jgi:hypothetical protein